MFYPEAKQCSIDKEEGKAYTPHMDSWGNMSASMTKPIKCKYCHVVCCNFPDLQKHFLLQHPQEFVKIKTWVKNVTPVDAIDMRQLPIHDTRHEVVSVDTWIEMTTKRILLKDSTPTELKD